MTGAAQPADSNTDIAIQSRHVWKLFGPRHKEALAAMKSQALTRQETSERFNCIAGVADVSLSIRTGEIFCIMGLSGSGKSTLVRHFNGLIPPTDGEIIVKGHNIADLSPKALRKLRAEKIAMVFQNFALLPHRTVLDNVSFGLELRGEGLAERHARAREVLRQVDLNGWENAWPEELSGGMQQRVGLARALAGNPEILLMDEPFGALDPLIRRQLQDQFIELSRMMRKTTVFITHDLDEAMRIGDRIAIMRDGRVIQVGTPDEILRNPADQYVADFVAGVSSFDNLTAHDVMSPIAKAGGLQAGVLPDHAPRVGSTASMAELATLAVESDTPIRVTDADDTVIGVVDRVAILKALGERGSR